MSIVIAASGLGAIRSVGIGEVGVGVSNGPQALSSRSREIPNIVFFIKIFSLVVMTLVVIEKG